MQTVRLKEGEDIPDRYTHNNTTVDTEFDVTPQEFKVTDREAEYLVDKIEFFERVPGGDEQ